ncbi:MAG: polyphosphate kinase 1 [Rhodospirillales bacterium]|nr:polyphosphate kinase 1 [Rhodospirillales bacterium]
MSETKHPTEQTAVEASPLPTEAPVSARNGAEPGTTRPVKSGSAKSARQRRAKTKADGKGVTEPASGEAPASETARSFDLTSPEWYLNRELTWLSFTGRVLHEARDKRTPVLERVKFLAIVASNLDEFFMKRIGGLKQQVGAGVHDRTVDGRTPQQQIGECTEVVRGLQIEMRAAYREIMAELRDSSVFMMRYEALSEGDRETLREDYRRNIFPFVTPLAMDPAHPFPFLSNLSLNLLVTLQHPDEDKEVLARVKVPVGSGVPRFLQVGATLRFVALEEVMAQNLDLLFPDVEVKTCETFRVTRNANLERDEDTADDLLALIESELRDRKFAPIVRLDTAVGIRPVHRGMLAAELGLDEQTEVFETDVLLGMRDLMEIASLDIPELHDANHHSVGNAKLQDNRSIFHIIRETKSIFLHHPYESFTTSVERFVQEASRDPKVRAIKMSLYRTSAGTKIIDYLVDAARNGKQVAVVVELKARFDEAANIRWATRLEEVGIHVNYGVVGLKTHSKVVQVLRMDYDGLRRYAHIGTGNYHADTARIYSDFGLLTCDEAIGEDVTELFNYLTTGLKPSRKYRKILTAPKQMKKGLIARIDREIENHTPERPGLIRFKCNALEDAAITEALYRASQAGVKVELIVRDTCRLRPGIPGLSENVTVISVVGRFLEHGRVYYFQNGGEEEYFIGSADLMTRNLESRVEVLAPVEDPALREELRSILEIQLKDQRSAWDMQPDGTYIQRRAEGVDEGSQQLLIAAAERRHFEATRLRRRKPRGIARRISALGPEP